MTPPTSRPRRPSGEIIGILTAHGARAILQEYDDHGAITGLSFQIDVGEQELGFRLPADWCAVLRVMERDRRVPRRLKTHEQARRVAWRILKDWIEAQIKPRHNFLVLVQF
jgi:hypothetical protein